VPFVDTFEEYEHQSNLLLSREGILDCLVGADTCWMRRLTPEYLPVRIPIQLAVVEGILDREVDTDTGSMDAWTANSE
jgi:hypothetical protein